MNGSTEQIKKIVSGLNNAKLNPEVEVVIAPPFPYLALAASENKQSTVAISGQDTYYKDNGAFTGATSVSMLQDVGATWVILGHSERRSLFGETSEEVAKKTKYALDKGMKVILCIGESKEERDSKRTFSVCSGQTHAVIKALSPSDWANVVIAYEPVWAIGTGLTATPADAQEVHKQLREFLTTNISAEVADATRIIYGGSVNAKTAPDLSKEADIDGFLVGGASLKPEFIEIINV